MGLPSVDKQEHRFVAQRSGCMTHCNPYVCLCTAAGYIVLSAADHVSALPAIELQLLQLLQCVRRKCSGFSVYIGVETS
jgi:hypothetical protein